MLDTPPLLLVPRLRPVTLASSWLVCTFLLVRLLASPAPVTVNVSPLTPVAVRYWPAKVLLPSSTRVPASTRSAWLMVSAALVIVKL